METQHKSVFFLPGTADKDFPWNPLNLLRYPTGEEPVLTDLQKDIKSAFTKAQR